jgi:hypothetical protein
MRDGPFVVICQIELETLSQFGNATNQSDTIAIFQRDRAVIERAVSEKYDRTSRRDYEILVVTPADLASAP